MSGSWSFLEVEDSHGPVDTPGFVVSGVGCDIRNLGNNRLDLGIIYSEMPCKAAGVFTKNRVKAAPVTYCMEVLSDDRPIHGVVVNSGNANACTGALGDENTARMARVCEEALGVPEGSFLVGSTGRIGRQLPMQNVEAGIEQASMKLSNDPKAGDNFCDSILTSDTRKKKATYLIKYGDTQVALAGAAKGAGMIRPDMATMLAYITTDLEIDSTNMKSLLGEVADVSFNSITVDGDMSTNDTVILFANGASGVIWKDQTEGFKTAFKKALKALCEKLAYLIVGDGEKITKIVTLEISGAASMTDAEKIGYAIAHSPLVKSSWAGSDPNWGRVVAAVGYSGVEIDPNAIKMKYDDVLVFQNGLPLDDNLEAWKSIVSKKTFSIHLEVGMGKVHKRLIASDLTPEYIEFNMTE